MTNLLMLLASATVTAALLSAAISPLLLNLIPPADVARQAANASGFHMPGIDIDLSSVASEARDRASDALGQASDAFGQASNGLHHWLDLDEQPRLLAVGLGIFVAWSMAVLCWMRRRRPPGASTWPKQGAAVAEGTIAKPAARSRRGVPLAVQQATRTGSSAQRERRGPATGVPLPVQKVTRVDSTGPHEQRGPTKAVPLAVQGVAREDSCGPREQRGPPTPHEAAWWRWQPGSARPTHRPVPRGGGGGGGCSSPPRGAATARQRLDGCVGSTSDPVQRRSWPSPPLRELATKEELGGRRGWDETFALVGQHRHTPAERARLDAEDRARTEMLLEARREMEQAKRLAAAARRAAKKATATPPPRPLPPPLQSPAASGTGRFSFGFGLSKLAEMPRAAAAAADGATAAVGCGASSAAAAPAAKPPVFVYRQDEAAEAAAAAERRAQAFEQRRSFSEDETAAVVAVPPLPEAPPAVDHQVDPDLFLFSHHYRHASQDHHRNAHHPHAPAVLRGDPTQQTPAATAADAHAAAAAAAAAATTAATADTVMDRSWFAEDYTAAAPEVADTHAELRGAAARATAPAADADGSGGDDAHWHRRSVKAHQVRSAQREREAGEGTRVQADTEAELRRLNEQLQRTQRKIEKLQTEQGELYERRSWRGPPKVAHATIHAPQEPSADKAATPIDPSLLVRARSTKQRTPQYCRGWSSGAMPENGATPPPRGRGGP